MGERNGGSAPVPNRSERDRAIEQPVSPDQVDRALDKAIERESANFRLTEGQKAALKEHA